MKSKSKRILANLAENRYSTRIGGLGNPSLGRVLTNELVNGSVSALGVVSAFVSVGGFRDLLAITKTRKMLKCRLLAGISGAITHPRALSEALDAGWEVRLGTSPKTGIFHPKMILSGLSFRPDGRIEEPSFAYVGSSNLTLGGLHRNIECGVFAYEKSVQPSFVSSFAKLWSSGKQATASKIHSYAEEFAKRNRKRSMDDLEVLGISDAGEDESLPYDELKRKRAVPNREVMPETAAAAAWSGLESFTGEYKFQVEFPQAAGLVLNRIFGRTKDNQVPILCVEDGKIRNMSYRFYPDNGMFRLNIPNDAPGVQFARRQHKGIALVEVSGNSHAAAQLTILRPGANLEDTVRRSVLLGTWGRTQTRNYGWYQREYIWKGD